MRHSGMDTLEMAHEYAEQVKTSARSIFMSADTYIAIISYTMANYFRHRITMNDHADVDFVPLMIKYLILFFIVFALKLFITKNARVVKNLIDVVIYDVVMDVFNFASILFVVIFVGLVQDYFEFGFEDLYSVFLLFMFFSFFTRLGDRVAVNARIQ